MDAPDAVKNCPPLREDPSQPDQQDGQRLAWSKKLWSNQDQSLRLRDRQMEENIRMLAGQQHSVWSPVFQRFFDISEFLTEEEQRWRRRPVFNHLLRWFIITHARLTENPPIVTFLPGPDRLDQELAETMDIVFKALWREVGMPSVIDRLMTVLVPGGSAYLYSRIDPNAGDFKPWMGQAMVQVVDASGNVVGEQKMPKVPLTEQGEPAIVINAETGEPIPIAEPKIGREGRLVVDVLSPLEVRGSWGNGPWHMKPWHQMRSYLTPEEVFNHYGVEVEPDLRGEAGGEGDELKRYVLGAGYFGAQSQLLGSEIGAAARQEGLCEITTLWKGPTKYHGMEETPESPGGRLLVHTQKTVLSDAVRPARFQYTSPIRRFDFVMLPGRAQGTSIQDSLNSPQRSFNRGHGQIQQHRDLVTNPIMLVDSIGGLQNAEITNEPGQKFEVLMRPNIEPVRWLTPPSLGGDVYQVQNILKNEIDEIGSLRGTGGDAPTQDASGELVKELRFNTDRTLGATARRAVEEIARMVEDWRVLIPIMWDDQKVLSYAGEDNVARTITVMPQMFEEGKIHVVADMESMLPEGRGEREAKVWKMWESGAFGPPGTPEANARFLELARFPHLARAMQPGGVQRQTARQFLGRLLTGDDPKSLPWFPWYDVNEHLTVMVEFMASPEFLKQDPQTQQALGMRWQMLAQLQAEQIAQEQAQLKAQAQEQEQAAGGRRPGGGPPSNGSENPRGEPASAHAPRSQRGEPYPTEPVS